MARIEEVVLRLAAIQSELAAIPDGPSTQRYQLLKERDSLRDEADGFASDADSGRTTAQLEAELSALVLRRKKMVGSRTGYVTGKGGGSASPVSGAWVKLGIQSMTASGIEVLNARISHIENVLAARRLENS